MSDAGRKRAPVDDFPYYNGLPTTITSPPRRAGEGLLRPMDRAFPQATSHASFLTISFLITRNLSDSSGAHILNDWLISVPASI